MIRELLLRQFEDIQPDEWPRTLLLSAFFFLIVATYWILKPLKRSIIINHFSRKTLSLFGYTFGGAEAEQVGKMLDVVLVVLAVMAFTWLARRVPRHRLVLIFCSFFAAAFLAYAFLLGQLTDAVVWSFYLFGDVYNTAMVALFWAFTNDVISSDEAKRTYGFIGLGGVLGGFVGATLVNSTVLEFGRPPLLLACIVPMVLIVVIAYAVQRLVTRKGASDERPAAPARGRTVALEGAKLVFASRYLVAIAATVAIYEFTSNIIDYQLASTVADAIDDPLEKDAFFAGVGQAIGITAVIVQLLLTSFVIRRYGEPAALSFLPLAVMAGSAVFFFAPVLFVAAGLSVSDNALNYSINQSAKEVLYTPTSSDVTYKAKAFIDMLVQRTAKVASVLMNLGFAALVSDRVRWLSLVAVTLGTVWLMLARYLGRHFAKESEQDG